MKATEKNELIKTMNTTLKTIGDLRKAKYVSKSIKTELRDNLIAALQAGKKTFEGMHGYEQTVIPQLERAILSKHNINLLGLRGQGKTRIARLMIQLLDEYIPIVAGSEINVALEVTLVNGKVTRNAIKGTDIATWRVPASARSFTITKVGEKTYAGALVSSVNGYGYFPIAPGSVLTRVEIPDSNIRILNP